MYLQSLEKKFNQLPAVDMQLAFVHKGNLHVNCRQLSDFLLQWMILDPTFKTSFWRKNEAFIMDYLHVSVDTIVETFRELLETYDEQHPQPNLNPSASSASLSKKSNKQSLFFSSELYDTTKNSNQQSVHANLSLYLKEETEPERTDILKYWFA